jgi:hypothetical protein
MMVTPRLLFVSIVGTLAFLGLAVLGWGDLPPSSRIRPSPLW